MKNGSTTFGRNKFGRPTFGRHSYNPSFGQPSLRANLADTAMALVDKFFLYRVGQMSVGQMAFDQKTGSRIKVFVFITASMKLHEHFLKFILHLISQTRDFGT
jgi:hypothetical protein